MLTQSGDFYPLKAVIDNDDFKGYKNPLNYATLGV